MVVVVDESGDAGIQVPGREEAHYRATPEGHCHRVIPEFRQLLVSASSPISPWRTNGRPFASTLLLSLSCAPLLKEHLLRTLNISNEELASIELLITDTSRELRGLFNRQSWGNLFIKSILLAYMLIQRRVHYIWRRHNI